MSSSSSLVSGIHGHLLEVTVVGCNKLKDTEWISRQDPYVCLEYANTKHRTRTCTDGGKNPTFQDKFVFSLIEGLRELNVTVWNSNTKPSKVSAPYAPPYQTHGSQASLYSAPPPGSYPPASSYPPSAPYSSYPPQTSAYSPYPYTPPPQHAAYPPPPSAYPPPPSAYPPPPSAYPPPPQSSPYYPSGPYPGHYPPPPY
ncbi:hypothetical protein ACFE04_003706 [Oxalis oulophora]